MKIRCYIFALLLLCTTLAVAQPHSKLSIAEAQEIIDLKKEDNLLKAYITLWNHYQYSNQTDSFTYIMDDGLRYFLNEKMHFEYTQALTYKARQVAFSEDKYKATTIFREALAYAKENDTTAMSSVSAKLALNFRSRNELDSATFYAYQAISKGKNLREKVKARTALADIEMDAGLWSSARDNLLYVLKYKSTLNAIEEYISLGNLVKTYGHLSDYDLYAATMIKLKEMQVQFEQPSESFHANSYFYSDLPADEQENFLRNSLKAFEKIGYHAEIGNTKVALARNLSDQNKTAELIDMLNQWKVEQDENIKLAHRIELLEMYGRTLSQTGYYERAHLIQGLFIALKDSLAEVHNRDVINELNTKYETAIKDQEIQRQESEIKSKTYQRNMLIGGLGGSFLVGILSFWGLHARNERIKLITQQESELRDEKITNLEKEKKLLSMSSLLEGQESERLRIAKELHDGLGALLTNVKAHFGKIQTEIEQVESLNIYTKANEMIDRAYDEVRRISHNLMPSDLRAGGLPFAIRQLVHELKLVHEIQTEFELIGITEERLAEKLELAAYRILQELVANLLKYSEASRVFIQLSKFENEIQLVVEDDGIGFDYDQALTKDGLGLKSILSRVQQLKGHIDFVSEPNAGTSVTVNLPLA